MTTQTAAATKPLDDARWSLAKLWLLGTGGIALILIGESMANVFRGQLQQVWSWALPTFLPTLALIVAVLGENAITGMVDSSGRRRSRKDEKPLLVRRQFYRLTFWLSVAYLLLILVTILAQPFTVYFASDPDVGAEDITGGAYGDPSPKLEKEATAADVLQVSNLWLAPVQGLVVAAMGVLFCSQRGQG